jgi:lysozyme
MLKPVVFDVNHNNRIGRNLSEADAMLALKNDGVVGMIHKAKQGIGYTDPKYKRRRAAAAQAGLMCGAYDFATHDDPVENAKDFLATTGAANDPNLSVWLDFEDNRASQMTAEQAYQFIDTVDQTLGRICGIYGGNRIREQITPHSSSSDWWRRHPLWLCQYKTSSALRDTDLPTLMQHISIPPPWTEFFLLQYTGDGIGPLPHTLPGLDPGADLNVFNGDPSELVRRWSTG